ncbi:IS3 family transposase [Psittacicella hinzii]|nr:IS3 family transposase [Psittacicella hinzii]
MKFSNLSLSDRKQILELALNKKLPYKEIALKYNISVGQIYSAVSRERNKTNSLSPQQTEQHPISQRPILGEENSKPSYTPKYKVQSILDLYEKYNGNLATAAKHLGMHNTSLRDWVKMFKLVGGELFIQVVTKTMKAQKAITQAELENRIIFTREQLNQELGVLKNHLSTLENQDDSEALVQSIKSMMKSHEQIKILELANLMLKKLGINKHFAQVDEITQSRVIKAITSLKALKYTVTSACDLLGIDRRHYYRNLKKNPVSSKERRLKIVAEIIIHLRDKGLDVCSLQEIEEEVVNCPKLRPFSNYGIRRINQEVNKVIYDMYDSNKEIRELFPHRKVNHKVVENAIREFKLYSKKYDEDQSKATRRIAHTSTKDDNLMARDFKCSLPYEKLGNDTVTFTVQDKILGKVKVYLCIVIDLYSRKIVGYCISDSPDTTSAIYALDMAMQNKPENASKTIMLQHDKGSQFMSQEYRNQIKYYKIIESVSGKGACYDNAPTESRFSCLRIDCEPKGGFKSVKHCKATIEAYINFHNNQRIAIHKGEKKGLTPQERISQVC